MDKNTMKFKKPEYAPMPGMMDNRVENNHHKRGTGDLLQSGEREMGHFGKMHNKTAGEKNFKRDNITSNVKKALTPRKG